jgi:glycosyltransferase involved in cell wall biosynthesis
MRVLLLHNRYRAEGGEERAVRDIAALLARRGDVVELLERSSAAAGRVRAGRALVRGGEDAAEVADAVKRLGADVVHGHNLHPLFGWRALAAAREAGARTVLHVHNFRLFCAIGVAYRDGAPCHRCRGANTLPGLRLRCRGSLSEAAVYAASLHNQQPHLLSLAERFVVLSDAHGAQLTELGLPADRTEVLPNHIPEGAVAPGTRADEGTYALVAGRLVEEKGFDTAIAAAKASGVPLVVAGEGPDEARLKALGAGADVRFTGWLEPDKLRDLRAGAAVVLVPSRCEEACPYAVLDSLAAGIPVLVSDRGGLPEMTTGALAAEAPGAWASALGELWADRGLRRERGLEALETARERFGEDSYYERLTRVYGCVPRPGSNQNE